MASISGRGLGSFFSGLNNWITSSSTGPNSGDQTKSFDYGSENDKTVGQLQRVVIQISVHRDKEIHKAFSIISRCPGKFCMCAKHVLYNDLDLPTSRFFTEQLFMI